MIQNIAKLPLKSYKSAVSKLSPEELNELIKFLAEKNYKHKNEKIYYVIFLLRKLGFDFVERGVL